MRSCWSRRCMDFQ